MFSFKKFPQAAMNMFTSLCLSQVKEQLPENLIYFNGNPKSFVHNGHLFVFDDNRAFYADESFDNRFSNLKFTHSYN